MYLWWVADKVIVHVVVYGRWATDCLGRLLKCLVLVCASCASLAGGFEQLVWVQHVTGI